MTSNPSVDPAKQLPVDKVLHNMRTLVEMAKSLAQQTVASNGKIRGLTSLTKRDPVKNLTRDDISKVDQRDEAQKFNGVRVHTLMGLAFLICPDKFHVEFLKTHQQLVQKVFPDSTHDKTGIYAPMVKLSIAAYSLGVYYFMSGITSEEVLQYNVAKLMKKKLQKAQIGALQQQQQALALLAEIDKDTSTQDFKSKCQKQFDHMLSYFFCLDEEIVSRDGSGEAKEAESTQLDDDAGAEPGGAAAVADSASDKKQYAEVEAEMAALAQKAKEHKTAASEYKLLTVRVAEKEYQLYRMDLSGELTSKIMHTFPLVMQSTIYDKIDGDELMNVMSPAMPIQTCPNVDDKVMRVLSDDATNALALNQFAYHLMFYGQFREAFSVQVRQLATSRIGEPRPVFWYMAAECFIKAKLNYQDMSEYKDVIALVDKLFGQLHPEWKERAVKRRQELEEKRTKNLAEAGQQSREMLISSIDIDTFLFIGELLEDEYLELAAVAKWKYAKNLLASTRRDVVKEVFETLAVIEGVLTASELAKQKPKKEDKKEKKEAKKKEKESKKSASKSSTPSSPVISSPTAASGDLKCAHCGAAASEEKKLSRCSRCMNVAYCSRQCQAADWAKHKSSCQRVQVLTVTLSDGKARKIPLSQGISLPALAKAIHEQMVEDVDQVVSASQ